MKRCPQCGRDYNDESLSFCLDDGTELLFGPASMDDPATEILSDAPNTEEAKTRTFGEAAKVNANAGERTVSKPMVMIAGFIGITAVVALAIAGYFYFNREKAQFSSIAVMPFVNASGSVDLEYLSDGMTESLMNSLSQLPNLSVRARSSVFRYKGKEVEPIQAGLELNVQALLNGRVVQRGDQLTLSLDLVDARTGDQIWGEQYVRKPGDLVALQNEIARDVSQKLRQRLTGEQTTNLTKNQTQNAEAYQLYLQGRYHWNKRTFDSTNKAIQYFQQALEKDPNYALAYVGLADSYIVGDMGLQERTPKIFAAANKALELDPTLGEAHAALGTARWSGELDYAGGEREYRRAIELSPNYATAYHWLGEFLIFQGRFEEGFAEYKKALDLDPLSMAISTDLGRAYYLSRQYDRSIEYFKKLIEMDPNYVRTHFYLARVYREKGMFHEAFEEDQKGAALNGEPFGEQQKKDFQTIADAAKRFGAEAAWKTILEFVKEDIRKGEKPRPDDVAELYARTGDKDKAFEWLEKAFESDDVGDLLIKVKPDWDNLRDDPRFAQLLKRAGFKQ